MNEKVATGVGVTTQLLPVKVDSYIMICGWVKSSKKMCGVPWLSTTRLENCVLTSLPLTSAGGENGRPTPAECDSRITDENAGATALPVGAGSGTAKQCVVHVDGSVV